MSENTTEVAFEKKDPKIRRVVTGHDAEGKSCVWKDGFATNLKYPSSRMVSALLWCCESVPADCMGEEDMGNRILGTAPPPGGVRFMFSELGPAEKTKPVPNLHKTDTIDFKIVISGEVTCINDKDEVILKPGDVFIGRGNNHAWFNHGTVPCRSVTLMLDGKPKREGSVSGMQQQREP